ncbi:GrpB family protein [Mangrovibacillus cuniculi]|uniref:GrpB family protein n=1 Tax=Mangrovibacillus cuniculi TaxID=2593652 RepID=A0A7S8CDA7_9BACI|nr:GrpB family protein [Mangrovibacillus cuniculi]QPC47874.1 GrpB family protein [Mangrovibacillus cuniculi]
MRKVEVTPYNDKWASMFKVEWERLQQIFGSVALNIHHIGSTAVLGLSAKPVIDILIEVKNITIADSFNKDMEELGYEVKGENGIEGRRYFQKGGSNRTHHVHVFQHGSPDVERHVAFRDFLRVHPDEAARYGQLKETLASRFPYDMAAYIDGKNDLVLEIEKKALEWYRMV